jgi:hypothetical protein
LSRNEALLQNILGEQNEIQAPISNIEKILLNILGYDGVDIDPIQSRNEALLLEILESGAIGASGINVDISVDYLSGTEWARGNLATNGNFTPSDTGIYYTSGFVDVSSTNAIVILHSSTYSPMVAYTAAFYDEDQQFIQRSVSASCNPSMIGNAITVIPRPASATYFRMATVSTILENGTVSLYAADGAVSIPTSESAQMKKGASSVIDEMPDEDRFIFDSQSIDKKKNEK